MPGAAPLSKPVTKKAVKHHAAPPMASQGTIRAQKKRPRPSDAEFEKLAVPKLDGMHSVANGERKGSAYKKGMYLSFIDDAFARRTKVRPPILV